MVGFVSIEQSAAIQGGPTRRETAIQKVLLKQILDFQQYINDSLLAASLKPELDEQLLKHHFLQARLLYKRFEWAAEYFTADLSKRLNGPPVEEVENADLLDPAQARGIAPMGLQVIEEEIFPNIDVKGIARLQNHIRQLQHNTGYLISYYNGQPLKDWRILDAAKLEIFRILTLGITGYDASLCLNSMEEASSALKSLQKVLSFYGDSKDKRHLNQLISQAALYLHTHTDFNGFDRAYFIRHYGNQMSTAIALLEDRLPGEKIIYNRMLNQNARTLFDKQAFNVDAFSPGPEWHYTPARALLGKRLFYDPHLSGTRTRSCASCHQPELAYTDGLPQPLALHDSAQLIARNVPTLLNAALQSNYFYDLSALTLEDQIAVVIQNPLEMDGSMEQVLKYLNQDSSYKAFFKKAYPDSKGSITKLSFTSALASYIKSLTLLNSRFDDYMQGNNNALNKEELQGFNLFMGKAKCATCHFMPLFNGTTPPKYIQTEAEVIGVPSSISDTALDKDLGYYAIIGVEAYKHAFKIPTIRNIQKTAPYMHNGLYASLAEVLTFYNRGGGAGLGLKVPNQSLSTDSLGLSSQEQKAIISFMGSLQSDIYAK